MGPGRIDGMGEGSRASRAAAGVAGRFSYFSHAMTRVDAQPSEDALFPDSQTCAIAHTG
jgi:hypothetical protein